MSKKHKHQETTVSTETDTVIKETGVIESAPKAEKEGAMSKIKWFFSKNKGRIAAGAVAVVAAGAGAVFGSRFLPKRSYIESTESNPLPIEADSYDAPGYEEGGEVEE